MGKTLSIPAIKESLFSLSVGLIVSILGILICWLFLPNDWVNFARQEQGLFINDCVSKYCSWDESLFWSYVSQNIKHWTAFTILAILLWRKHPRNPSIPFLSTSIKSVSVFIFGCGLVNLLEAYSAINPVYCFVTIIEQINADIAMISSIFSCWAISYGIQVSRSNRKKLDKARRELYCGVVD